MKNLNQTHSYRNNNTKKQTNKHLSMSMPQRIMRLFDSQLCFSNQLMQNLPFFADRPSNTKRVNNNHTSNCERNEKRSRRTFAQINRSSQRRCKRTMRARHAARSNQIEQVHTACFEVKNNNFHQLRTKPCGKNGNKQWISKYICHLTSFSVSQPWLRWSVEQFPIRSVGNCFTE